MYAIVKDGSRQFRAEKGLEIEVDRKSAKAGETIEFAEVLALHDGKAVTFGRPTVAGAKVVAEVVAEVKGVKLRVFKYRRREGYHRTVGHRQKNTVVRITEIVTK